MTKIKSTELTKFQRLNYVQIAPSGSLVALAGRNKQGKSSYLDGLEAAICGHNGRVITRPINDGADKAGITVETDDGLIINRTYTAAGSKLTIKAADGAKYGQAKLDSLLGELGIDSSRFASLNDKDQLKTLLSLPLGLDFDPAQLDAERKAIFDERTDVNRREKDLKAAVASIPVTPEMADLEEVSVSDLVRAHQDGQRLNTEIQKAKDYAANTAVQVAKLRQALEAAEVEAKAAKDRADSAPPIVDTAALQSKIDNAETINAGVRTFQSYTKASDAWTVAAQQTDALTAKLEAIDKRKAAGLAAAKFPVDDLSFDSEGVLYKGRPFSRASSAEKVLVSAAMMIALNPELRVLIVRNGNDLDSDSLATLEAMAADADFQIFIEIVNETGDFGITIEDGEVVA